MENNENLEDRIVDVAKDVFLENGFEMTSMSDIAAKVGINRPTLHYYFRTKERMFRAVLAPIFETFMPKVQTILAGDIPFIERLEKILDEYLIIFSENPFLPRFVLSEIQRNPDNLILMIHLFYCNKDRRYASSIAGRTSAVSRLRISSTPMFISPKFSCKAVNTRDETEISFPDAKSHTYLSRSIRT